MPLPLVRASEAGGASLPSAERLIQCMQLATTAEASTYLYQQATKIFAKMRDQAPVQQVIDNLKLQADTATLVEENKDAGIWSGKPRAPDFAVLQSGLSSKAAAVITEMMGSRTTNVTFDYAVGAAAQFLRGYSKDGLPLPDEVVAELDTLFSSWLSENNMISKGGVIYQADENGQIKKDAKGNPAVVDVDKLRERISNNADGFERYVEKNSKTIQLKAQEQAYPEAEKKEEVTPG